MKYLEGESLLALRLPPDDDDAEEAEQCQNDTHSYPYGLARHQLIQIHSQHHTQQSNQHRCGGDSTQRLLMAPDGFVWIK